MPTRSLNSSKWKSLVLTFNYPLLSTLLTEHMSFLQPLHLQSLQLLKLLRDKNEILLSQVVSLCCGSLLVMAVFNVYETVFRLDRLMGLMPRSHQSLNIFKSCLVKHGLKLFSLAAYWCFFLLQIQHKLKNMFKFI